MCSMACTTVSGKSYNRNDHCSLGVTPYWKYALNLPCSWLLSMACIHFFSSSITSFLLLTSFRELCISCRGPWFPLPELLESTLLQCKIFGCGCSLFVWSGCIIYWAWTPSLPSWSTTQSVLAMECVITVTSSMKALHDGYLVPSTAGASALILSGLED